MSRIQRIALDAFDEHRYRTVTVKRLAAVVPNNTANTSIGRYTWRNPVLWEPSTDSPTSLEYHDGQSEGRPVANRR